MRLEGDRGIRLHVPPRHQQIALAKVGALAEPIGGRQNGTVDGHCAGIRFDQPGDHVQQRALARAGRSDDRHELARRNGERDTIQHRQPIRPLDIRRRYIAQLNCRGGITHIGSMEASWRAGEQPDVES